MSLQVKLYIQPTKEIRRFVLDPTANFVSLQQRVKELVGHNNVRLYWQDNEGDQIVCDNDEELQAARQSVDANNLLRLYARPGKEVSGGNERDEKQVHRNITCDGCQGSVAGTRYKCTECPDYDLCEVCQHQGIHREHDMLALRRPHSDTWKKFFGQGYANEGVHGPATGGPCGAGPGTRGPCGFRRRGGPGGFMPPFMRAGLGNMMQNLAQTVEMDIDMNRPLPEVIAEITKKVQEAVSRASQQQPAGEKNNQEEKMEIQQDEKSATENDSATAAATAVADAVSTVADIINQSFGNGSQIPSEADGWTHLQPEPMQTEMTVKPDDAPQQQQSGNRIEAALQAMQEMGFVNEGNLLRRLLENYNGDIARVLDSIK